MKFDKRTRVAISVGVAIPLVAILLITALPSTTTYKSAQFGDTSLEFQVETAEKVFIGKVLSVEVRQIDQHIEVPDDPEASFTKQDLYQFVTVEATKYLKDKTGKEPQQVTFFDDVSGCFDALQKQCQVAEFAVEYKVGEEAVFLVERIDDPADGPLDGLLTTLGFTEKYKISDDEAQSEYEKTKDKEPMKLADLEKEINDITVKGAKD